MGRIEDAIIFACEKHKGQTRKIVKLPYILHPMEVAQIISTVTTDEDIIIAGLLHDVLEDTQTSSEEIKNSFGQRVLDLVNSETENKYRDENPEDTWKRRKNETLKVLRESDDIAVKIMWLSDKLSNLRSLCRNYANQGDEIWGYFHQKDPMMHKWYYAEVYSLIEEDLGQTEAGKEYKMRMDMLWQ